MLAKVGPNICAGNVDIIAGTIAAEIPRSRTKANNIDPEERPVKTKTQATNMKPSRANGFRLSVLSDK
jgi:hypothetical protein